jgi:hypothetical protein
LHAAVRDGHFACCRLDGHFACCLFPTLGEGLEPVPRTHRSRESELVQDIQGVGVFIERVQVDAGGAGVQGRVGEFNCGGDADGTDLGFSVGRGEAVDEFGGWLDCGELA